MGAGGRGSRVSVLSSWGGPRSPWSPSTSPFERWKGKGLSCGDHRTQAASAGPCAWNIRVSEVLLGAGGDGLNEQASLSRDANDSHHIGKLSSLFIYLLSVSWRNRGPRTLLSGPTTSA